MPEVGCRLRVGQPEGSGLRGSCFCKGPEAEPEGERPPCARSEGGVSTGTGGGGRGLGMSMGEDTARGWVLGSSEGAEELLGSDGGGAVGPRPLSENPGDPQLCPIPRAHCSELLLCPGAPRVLSDSEESRSLGIRGTRPLGFAGTRSLGFIGKPRLALV